jgi:polyisoprenoid-binding protein YceI/rhodanese-related sulfurtransferase
MTARELLLLVVSGHPPQLLHVLPPEVFAAARIPGSHNACVYETTFLDQVRALPLDPAAPLVVYGAGGGSLDAATAAEKLRAAGLFPQLQVYEGGLIDWDVFGTSVEAIASGIPVFQSDARLPLPPVPDGTFRLDTAQSVIRWTGRNLFNHHSGTVRLAGGEIVLQTGQLISARFTIDMASIACEDLADQTMNAMLLAHLHTTDFFDVAQHPTAEFVTTAAEPIAFSTEGTPNYHLFGTFTLRGIRQPLSFPIVVATTPDGQSLTGQAQFELDRTAYGSQYGSGKLYRFLGKHLVNDHVHLHVKIHGENKKSTTLV